MRIIQITDLHINSSSEEAKGDADTRANFFLILQQIIDIDYDLLVISGDFCLDKPKLEIYKWVKEQLTSTLDLSKILVIPGNHDNTKMLHQQLCPDRQLHGNELFFTEACKDQKIILLDTGIGSASDQQKSWLREQITKNTGQNVFIFMHHPPLICGVKYMDNHHSLEDMKDFQEIFSEFPHLQFHIFCGHYHVDRTIVDKNVHVYITPSSYVQIDPNAATFVPDHYDIGYRNIEIDSDQKLITEVRYIL